MLPIPDLRNNLNEISEFCRETREPLTQLDLNALIAGAEIEMASSSDEIDFF